MMPGLTRSHHTALLDLGNTRVKVGWVNRLNGEREYAALALEYKDTDHIVPWLNQQNVTPDTVIGVNVAGKHNAQTMEALFLNHIGIAVQWRRSEHLAAGVLNRYRESQQLGADRWIAMIGLSQVVSDDIRPRLLASFGTATTVDTLCPTSLAPQRNDTHSPLNRISAVTDDADWVYEGGLIFPGPALMRSSLANNTAQLPAANGPTAAFPTDTHQAITTGIAAAQAGALMRQWQMALSRYGLAPRVYCTGGGWPIVKNEVQALLTLTQRQNKLAEQPIQYLSSPILDGLARVAQRF